jgi:hypothetical protein
MSCDVKNNDGHGVGRVLGQTEDGMMQANWTRTLSMGSTAFLTVGMMYCGRKNAIV